MEIALGIIGAAVGIISILASAGSSKMQQASNERLAREQQMVAEHQLDVSKDIADKNFNLSKEQFEYQKQLNQLQMQREDTAMQRQVADLKAAGLSPLMAGSGASTGQLISAAAPQYDGSGIMQALSNMIGVKQDYARRKQEAYMFERQQGLQMAQQFANLSQLKLDNEYKREQIRSQKIINDYNEKHGPRDPNAQAAIVDAIQSYLQDKNSPKDLVTSLRDDAKEVKEAVHDYVNEYVSDKVEQTKEMATSAKKFVVDHTPQSVKNKVSAAKDIVDQKAEEAAAAIKAWVEERQKKKKSKK